MNSECFQWDEGEEDLILADPSLCQDIEVFAVTRAQAEAAKRPAPSPPPPIEAPHPSRVPEIGPLTANILKSRDNFSLLPIKSQGQILLSGLW